MRTLPLAILVFAAATAHAQQAGITQLPDSVVSRIDRVLNVAGGAEAPGCAIGIARDGKVVLTRAYGLANLEDGVPNTPETVFESGSVAKQFTAASVVLLAQDGKLSLDDDIRKYLPEMHDFGKRITIRNLLTHTSGLRDWYTLAALKGQPAGAHVHSLATILDLASHQKTLNFEPGSEYLYSNTGYILAAIIVQRVSGMPFPAFTDERLFKPLGMTHTQWRDDFTKIVKGRATGYTGSGTRGYTLDMPFVNVIGSGGLLTTVGDWMKWNSFLDNPAGIAGGASLVQAMTTPMTLNNGKKIAYALGLSVSTRDGMREISHSGSTAGYRTWLGRYPDEKLSVAVMCNAGDGVNPTTVANTATQAVLARPARSLQAAGFTRTPLATLKLYEGVYVGPTPEAVTKLVARDSELVVAAPANRPLSATGPNRFRLGASDVEFVMQGSKVSRMLQITGSDTTTFTPYTDFTPTTKELALYLGTFWNDETDSRISFVQRDSVLMMRQEASDSARMRPTIPDTFTSNYGTFAFERDSKGRISAVTLWAGRARNIRFTKEK